MNRNIQAVKEEVKEYACRKPKGEYKFGLFIQKVGYKYVHVLNLHSNTTVKVPLETFCLGQIHGVNNYVEDLYDLGVS